MRCISLLLLFVMGMALPGWPQPVVKKIAAPAKTYAVIIGISSYQTEGITRLDFAHKDAEAFEKFLRSPAGGMVPEDNIRLLLNDNASYTAIYNALYWLLETCNKNDLVYFYFSGHGDMENTTIYKLGFLLAANTPRSNYINNAVRIEDLNNIANTLSVEKGAKVVLITDACHSGKLAGNDNRGNFLVGNQLRTVKGNEIRITSSGPDELSNEDERWGGGRGVFSYYLVKGLEGLADKSKDRVVTLDEIKNYLNTALAADKVLAEKVNKQSPVVQGPADSRLSKVNPAMLAGLERSVSQLQMADGDAAPLTSLGISPQGYLLGLISTNNIEELVDFNKLSVLTMDKIPFAFISMLQQAAMTKTNEVDIVKIQRLEKSLRDNKDALKRFNEKLVELLSGRGQQIINLYLDADEAELERRRYYNSRSSGYDIYPTMFAIAQKLVPAQSQLHHILQVKYHYFAGVTARLKIPLVENPAGLLDTAMREQLAALKLEENAAYIHNELGILYKLKKDYTTAEKYFLRATQISSTWALPWSNLGGLYNAINDYEKGIAALEKAKQLQPGFQGIYINTGILNEKKGNLLLAEEFFQKSIRINTRHYLPFERLGYVFMNTTRYAAADSNFHEADIRKKGYKFLSPDADGDGVTDQFDVEAPPGPCVFDTTTVRKNDIIGNFFIALSYMDAGKLQKAEWKLKQLIQLDPVNPLAFHYLGTLLFHQQRWKEADIIFNYALENHLNPESFERYCDSLLKLFPQYNPDETKAAVKKVSSCVFYRFQTSWVKKMTTHFFLGTAYERWNHPQEAEKQFRTIIREDSLEIGAYNKLWTLLENWGRYADAEMAIQSYPDNGTVRKELFAFYNRIIKRHPDRGEWYYKAGSLVYDRVALDPEQYGLDKKYIKIETDQEFYFDKWGYREQDIMNQYFLPTGESYLLYNEIPFPITEGINHFSKAATLITHNDILAEINYKSGDLYVWQGLPNRAEYFYAQSLTYNPDDANTRIKLISTNKVNYNLGMALQQLDTLYEKKAINFSNQVLMGEYCIHAGRFEDAGKLLKEAQLIHPYKISAIAELNGRLHLVANKPKLAIPFYQDYLSLQPDDKGVMYSIASSYAKLNNATEAFKWLKSSIDKGFNYYWVLKFDESWNAFRTTSQWKELTGKISPVNYKRS